MTLLTLPLAYRGEMTLLVLPLAYRGEMTLLVLPLRAAPVLSGISRLLS